MANDQVKQADDSLDIEVAETVNPPATQKKVELDLDDAPFLQKDEKPPEPEAYDNGLDNVSAVDDAEKRKRRKKKLMILGGGAGLLLVAVCAAVWWFFFRVPPPPPPSGPEPEVVVVPSTPPPAPDRDIVREFAPFVVPSTNAEGQERFLVCKFAAISRDPKVNQEMAERMVPLRDAIYYYLRGKDGTFLLDARNGAQIKRDLLSVFNDYLSQGKLEDIVFESYLSK